MVGRFNTFPLSRLRDEMGRTSDLFPWVPALWGNGHREAFPALNVWEDSDNLCVEAELPGVRSDNLEISVTGDQLLLKGERRELQHEGATFHRRERGAGSFARALRLPFDVDANGVEAAFKDGVLLIKPPKAEAAKPRKIQVNAAR